jgi:tyrosine-protein phosphatase SIW14
MRNQFIFKFILCNFFFCCFFYFASAQIFKKRQSTWAQKIEVKHLENFYKVNDTIYRCEQPDKKAFKQLEKMGIKSDLNLRDNYSDKDDLKKRDIETYRVKMNSENIEDKDIIKALRTIVKAPKPLVVHCKHGADRTGVVMAMYRIVMCNWTKKQAIAELEKGGYHFKTKYVNIIKYITDVDVVKIKKLVFDK